MKSVIRSDRSLTCEDPTAPALIFDRVTASRLSCAVPTLFLGSVTA